VAVQLFVDELDDVLADELRDRAAQLVSTSCSSGTSAGGGNGVESTPGF
jgi:hypothetical protein